MSTSKRICIVHPMDPLGKRIGGVASFVNDFIRFSPQDYAFSWIGITSDKTRVLKVWDTVEVSGRKINFFPILFLKDENRKSLVPLSLKFVVSLCFRQIEDLNLNNSIMFFHRIESILPFRLKSDRNFLVMHGNPYDIFNPNNEVAWKCMPHIYMLIEKYLIRFASKIFVVSQQGVDLLKKRYLLMENKISFLPTWVDQEIFHPVLNIEGGRKIRESYALALNEKVILFVGRLERAKDPSLLLKTFHYLLEKEPLSKLIIVGEGMLRKKLEEEVKNMEMRKKVYFTGSVDRTVVANLLKICDVFLLTSEYEGMPVSVLEALASGCPVISVDVGEVRRVVRNGISGEIVMERNPEALGEAVLGVLRNPQKYSVQNCVESVKDYSAPKVLEKIYTVFNE